MKKFLTLIISLCCAFGIYAQRAGEASVWNNDSEVNHSGFFLNPTIGVMTGDVDTDFGIDLTVGYRLNLVDGLSWDILKVGANTGVSNFSDLMTLRFLSGFRYNSPEIVADKSLYADFSLGYCLMTEDTDLHGFAYEVGAGVNLTSNLSLGIVWEGNNPRYSYEDGRYEYTFKYSFGTIGLRLGLNF